MAEQTSSPALRINTIFLLLVIAALALGLRIVHQVRHVKAETIECARQQRRRVMPLPARPGSIWAISGNSYHQLAGSRRVPLAFVDPFAVHDIDPEGIDGLAAQLAGVLSMDAADIRQQILDRPNARYVVLKRNITDSEVAALEDLGLQAMVGVSYEWRRFYPNGTRAANMVGFCYERFGHDRDALAEGEEPGTGLELTMAPFLARRNGRDVMLTDSRRRPIERLVDESYPAEDGAEVYLTLDLTIQQYLEEALAEIATSYEPQFVTGVVVEPATGRILAMASLPTFDPNAFDRSAPEDRMNHAILSPYEPGSVLKPLIAAAAVDRGLVNYTTRIDCENGEYRPPRGGRITDHGQRYGILTVAEIIIRSSNIGMAKIGAMMGNRALYDTLGMYGFGQPTGVGLPGEEAGIVRPLSDWDTYSTPRVPFGQEVSVTSLQLAMAFAALANDGQLMRPILVERIVGPDQTVIQENQPQVVRHVVSPRVARESVDVMSLVVEEGTGRQARSDRWTMFGKTGTAQVAGPGGYVDGAYVGSFVGGGPVGAPRVVCLISVYRPDRARGYYGGTVAAPFVRRVIERTLSYLDVPEDR
jgi:cell division protein FtsI/penicillin-binding protein 2